MTAEELAHTLIAGLAAEGMRLATAESCTGGLIAATLTTVPGSSMVVEGAVVAYDNRVKQRLLGVEEDLLMRHGAVSPEVAAAMVVGCRERLQIDFALSVTGIAGPQGGSAEKPVGLVFVGAGNEKTVQVRRCVFPGNRDQVRTASIAAALELGLQVLQEPPRSA
ncbi:MAG: CinA family protein [Geminicoccaceae bacterium]